MNTYLSGAKNRKKVFVNDTEHEDMVSTEKWVVDQVEIKQKGDPSPYIRNPRSAY
jgi:hypothetical protein